MATHSRTVLDESGAEKLLTPGGCIVKHHRYKIMVRTDDVSPGEIKRVVTEAVAKYGTQTRKVIDMVRFRRDVSGEDAQLSAVA